MKFLLVTIIMTMSFSTMAKGKLPDRVAMENNDYLLCKEYTIKYAFVIKIAHVGLYLQDCDNNEDILQISDKLVRFNYQVDVKAQFFVDSAQEFYLKNRNNAIDDKEKKELEKFNNFYQNMQENDYYDLYQASGEKLGLYKNDKLLGTSTNSAFSKNYFNIWFGQYPAIKKLKKKFT